MKSAVGLTGKMEEHNRQSIVDLFHAQVGIKKIAEVVGVHETAICHMVDQGEGQCLKGSPGPPANKKRIPDFMEQLRAKIDEDLKKSMRAIAKDMSCDESVIRDAMGDLGMKSFIRCCRQLLTEALKEKRLVSSR